MDVSWWKRPRNIHCQFIESHNSKRQAKLLWTPSGVIEGIRARDSTWRPMDTILGKRIVLREVGVYRARLKTRRS